MRTRQTGFTMIELIIVIIILGILAATALPKFIDMRADAEHAAIDGMAGAASSAMNLNYSGCALKNNVPLTGYCVTINLCSQVGTILQGGLNSNYTAAPNVVGTDITAVNGNTATCKLTKGTYTATFTGISAGN